ncbi:MAG: metal-sensitive transcriptional regulator [Fimbriimonadaceae bacterium]
MSTKTGAIQRRLSRAEGQIRGVRRLVDEGAYCCDILNQLNAARSALDQIAAMVASNHIRHCIVEGEGHEQAKGMSQTELLEEMEEVLSRLVR